MSLFEELKRRNVFRVGIAWVLMGWVVLQGADFVLDLVGAPDWVIRAMAVIGVAGLPIALFFAWAFEVTPEGIKREEDVDRTQSITPHTGRKLDRAIIVFLAAALVLVLTERFLFERPTQESKTQQAATTAKPAAEQAESTEPALDEGQSIAVLPFVNISPDAGNEYFADGLSEEILNVLTRVPDLKVTARTSAFSFKGSDATIAEIAGKLGVQNVLEGSVRRAGDRVRITAQLVAADGEFHLWSEIFDRELDDIFAVQDEIAQAIVNALELTLTEGQRNTLVSMPTENIEAYNLYLQGRQLWHQRSARELQLSINLLQEAVQLDPGFALAWAALADAYVLLPEYGRRENRVENRQMIQLARDASNRALELSPAMAQALTTRGYLRYMYDFDWVGAEQDLLRAMELEPAYPTARQWYAEFVAVRHRDIDGALEHLRKAAQLDPLAPIMWHVAGWLTEGAGREEEAAGYYQKALTISPTFIPSYGNLARMYTKTNQYDLSRQALDRARQLADQPPLEQPMLADALEFPEQRAAYMELLRDDPSFAPGVLDTAFDYMLLGEPELAMADLEKGLAEGDPYAVHANRMVIYDELRDNPRFQAHLRKMNFEP